jgi:hypothetical protein
VPSRQPDLSKATRTAAREWARRWGASMRIAMAAMDRQDWDEATEWAAQAAGEACEPQNVVEAFAAGNGQGPAES